MVFQGLIYHDYSSSDFSSYHDAVCVPVGSFVKNLRYKFWVCPFFIGFMLLTESAHLSNAHFWKPCDSGPKGYLYFAISFSLMVEVINMKASKRKKVKRF
jgi:predicted tellurium resistance membrane protein TerC